jgi:hypothetical protein
MRFSHGVYAQLTFKKDIEEDCSMSYYLYDSRDVYEHLVEQFGHDRAANAEAWTELASVGEWYEDDDFEIEMMEE